MGDILRLSHLLHGDELEDFSDKFHGHLVGKLGLDEARGNSVHRYPSLSHLFCQRL